NPRDISLLRNYLVALENFGDVEEALRLRRQIAEQAPQDLNNRRALAILLAREGQTQEAQQTVEKLIAEEGRDRDNMMTLATVQRFSGQAQAGEQTLETYLADLGSQAQAQDHVALAQYRLSIGDTDGALEAYQQGMRIEDPETRPVTRELADLLFEQRALDQAITLYQQLHEQFPDDLRVTLRLAESLILAQRYDESEPLLSPLKPSAQVHALRAMMALGRGDRQRARLLFNQALELEPRNPVILLERARLNANDPDPAWTQAAERDLREILSFKPDAHEARLLLAQLLLDRQETDEAARELRSVLSLAPQHIPARLMLLDLYVSRQDWTSAQSLLTEAANLYPQADAWPRLLAQVAAQQGQTEKAQQHWRHVLDLAPTPQNVGDFAVYLLKIGKPDQVLELLREHAQVTESYVSLQALRGRALAATNQREQAQRVFAVALGRCQSLGEVGMLAAQMKEALGLPDTISALEVAQSPAPLWRQIVLAQLEVADHKYDQALKRLEASEAQIPADEAAVRAMVQGIRANALQGQGRYQEAQQLYEQLLEAHPQDVQTLNNLAYLLADNLNDASRALPLAQRAADLAPRSAQVLDTLGWAQYKAGQVENALQTLQQALTLEPLAPVYLHLSIIYADLQNTDEARTSLKEAIRLAENSNDQEVLSRAQELLAQLGTP
ncbi:MAG TPA: tetratricopeptide repeat protein, partial [Phycisphaeraceae bacterium]